MTAEMVERYRILHAAFPKLDRIELDALLEVAAAIRDGDSTAEAYRRGNEYLVANGYEPVSLP